MGQAAGQLGVTEPGGLGGAGPHPDRFLRQSEDGVAGVDVEVLAHRAQARREVVGGLIEEVERVLR